MQRHQALDLVSITNSRLQFKANLTSGAVHKVAEHKADAR